jgi:hypothetical protein
MARSHAGIRFRAAKFGKIQSRLKVHLQPFKDCDLISYLHPHGFHHWELGSRAFVHSF